MIKAFTPPARDQDSLPDPTAEAEFAVRERVH